MADAAEGAVVGPLAERLGGATADAADAGAEGPADPQAARPGASARLSARTTLLRHGIEARTLCSLPLR
jgi:hypothetical protein